MTWVDKNIVKKYKFPILIIVSLILIISFGIYTSTQDGYGRADINSAGELLEVPVYEEVAVAINPKSIQFDQHLSAESKYDNRPIIDKAFILTHRLVNETIEGRQYTPYCLSDCHVLIEYQVTEDVEFNKANLKTKHTFNVQDINSKGIDVLITVGTKKVQVGRTCEPYITYSKNLSEIYNYNCTDFYETRDVQEWRSLDSVYLEKGVKYYFDYWIKKKAKLGHRKIDIIPTLYDSIDLPYAIVESDYQYKKEIFLNLDAGDTCVGMNCPVFLNITGLTLAQNNCSKELAIVADITLEEVDKLVIDNTREAAGDGSEECFVVFTTNMSSGSTSFWAYYNSSTATSTLAEPHWYDMFGGFYDGTDDGNWAAIEGTPTITYGTSSEGYPYVDILSTGANNYGNYSINPMGVNFGGGYGNGTTWRSLVLVKLVTDASADNGIRTFWGQDGTNIFILDWESGTTFDVNGGTGNNVTGIIADGNWHLLEMRRYQNTISYIENPHLYQQRTDWNGSAPLSSNGLQANSYSRAWGGADTSRSRLSLWGIAPTFTDFYVNVSFSEQTNSVAIPPIIIDYINLNSSTNVNYSDADWLIKNVNVSRNLSAPKLVYNWHNNNETGMILNMPFETGSDSALTPDYSNYGNNGTVEGATWNATSGYDGRGAYKFDGDGDYITILDTDILDLNTTDFSVSYWVNLDEYIGIEYFVKKSGTNGWNFHRSAADNLYFTLDFVGSTFVSVYGNSGAVSVYDWHHIVGTVDRDGDLKLYVDGVLQNLVTDISGYSQYGLGTNSNLTMGSNNFNGTIDDLQIIGRALTSSEVSELYENRTWNLSSSATSPGQEWETRTIAFDNSDVSSIFKANFTVRTNEIAIEKNLPITPYNSSNLTVIFNCSAFTYGSDNLQNITLILNDVYNYTETFGSVKNSSFETSILLGNGEYNWSCIAIDTISLSNQSNDSFIGIDNVLPAITINHTDGIKIVTALPNFTYINWTVYDINSVGNYTWLEYSNKNYSQSNWTAKVWDNGWYYDLATNQTGDYNLTIHANDTYGNEGLASKIITIYHYNYSVTPGAENIVEGATNTITLLVDFSGGPINVTGAYLIWNNTNMGVGTTTQPNANSYQFLNTFVVPQGLGSTDGTIINYYWNFTITGIVNDTTPTSTQTVTSIGIDDCSTYEVIILNYSMLDEKTKTNSDLFYSNPEIEIDVSIYSHVSESYAWNYSTNVTANNLTICILGNVTNYSSFKLYSTVQYKAIGTVNEYHYIQNYNLSNENNPQNINLYALNESDSTSFLVTFKNTYYLPIENAVIDLWRYYVGDGGYVSVEHGKTNDQGQTVLHFVTEDYKYKFYVRKEGELLWNSQEHQVICQTTPCTISLQEQPDAVSQEDYENIDNLDYQFVLNQTTRTATITYSTQDGSSTTVSLNGTLFNSYGNTTACYSTATSSGGTLTCIVPDTSENATYYFEFRENGHFGAYRTMVLSFGESFENFGGTGIILTVLLYGTLVGMASSTGVGIIIFSVVGLTFASLLGIFGSGTFIGRGAPLVWLIIAAGVMLWKRQKNKRGY